MLKKIYKDWKKKKANLDAICKATGWSRNKAKAELEYAESVGMSAKQYVKTKAWKLTHEQIEGNIRKFNQRIATICEKTGWDREKAVSEMAWAKSIGITNNRYVSGSCWKKSHAQMEEEVRQRNERIRTICEATGWERNKAIQEMNRAKQMGISPVNYVSYEGWFFTEEELLELKDLLNQLAEKTRKNQEWYLMVICEKTGWPLEEARRLVQIAVSKGYKYSQFISHGLFRKTEEELNNLTPYVSEIPEIQKKDEEKRLRRAAEFRKIIAEEMGWTYGRTRLESLRSNIVNGSTAIEYYLFNIYKYGAEYGKQFITYEYSIKMQMRYCDWGGSSQHFQDKSLFNKDFSEFVRRRWFMNQNLTFEAFKKNVEGLDRIIYKPLCGIEGIGITVFELGKTDESLRAVYEQVCTEEKALIEEFLQQHEAISAFYPHSVNTIRVMSILDNGEGKILNAVIKFATSGNVDNYFQGSIAAGVDEKTGIIRTEGVDRAGNIHKYHPYSGKEFQGFQIPHWDNVIETIRKAATVHKDTAYVGWDIAIAKDGNVEIIEGNHNQGAYLVQFPFAVYSGEGRRYTIDPYL